MMDWRIWGGGIIFQTANLGVYFTIQLTFSLKGTYSLLENNHK